jgi:hypothetical protein
MPDPGEAVGFLAFPPSTGERRDRRDTLHRLQATGKRLTSDTIQQNDASAGFGDALAGTGWTDSPGAGGTGGGGGLYVAGGTVSATSCLIESNTTFGGTGGAIISPATGGQRAQAGGPAWMSKAARSRFPNQK